MQRRASHLRGQCCSHSRAASSSHTKPKDGKGRCRASRWPRGSRTWPLASCRRASLAPCGASLLYASHQAEEPDFESTYKRWSISKWNELETKEQKRRAVEVPKEGEADPKKAKLPPGDQTRGWHKHWRRGVFGALRSWAAGDRGAIVYMLAACVPPTKDPAGTMYELKHEDDNRVRARCVGY